MLVPLAAVSRRDVLRLELPPRREQDQDLRRQVEALLEVLRGFPEQQPGARLPRSPAEYARRFYYDTLVFDRRALRYLVDMIGPGQLLVGTDFPAMPREQPAGRTLRSLGLPEDVVEDITWRNCFRFLGVPPR